MTTKDFVEVAEESVEEYGGGERRACAKALWDLLAWRWGVFAVAMVSSMEKRFTVWYRAGTKQGIAESIGPIVLNEIIAWQPSGALIAAVQLCVHTNALNALLFTHFLLASSSQVGARDHLLREEWWMSIR